MDSFVAHREGLSKTMLLAYCLAELFYGFRRLQVSHSALNDSIATGVARLCQSFM